MKIVINRQFGGFSLSPLATKMLAKRKGRKCYFFRCDRSGGTINLHKHVPITLEQAEAEIMWTAYDIPNPDEVCPSQEKWFEMSQKERVASNEEWSRHAISNRDIKRDDLDLIAVVQKLGKKANGKYASLKIVNIPKGVEWEIEEYDGNEWVSEKHRQWR